VVVENLTLSEKLTLIDAFSSLETHQFFPVKSQKINRVIPSYLLNLTFSNIYHFFL
jgi:hypothetical protein